jgi:putative CocE/NonD family hydrolase
MDMTPARPSWSQRAVDALVARATKAPGPTQRYTRFTDNLPMRDGAFLVADVYLPERPKATVLIRSPYGRGFPIDLLHARVFARHGYQVVLQSVRGRSGSTGTFQPMVTEGDDGQDTVRWLRDQDWYAGRLATFGGSYLGFAQWALLSDPPEEHGAAVVVVGPHDFSRAIWRDGAFGLSDMFGWSLAMAAPEGGGPLRQAAGMRKMHRESSQVMAALPLREACDAALAGGAPWFGDWLDHNDAADPFWDGYRVDGALKKSDVPTLLIGGWRDAFIDQTLEQYDALRSRNVDVALTVGPWTHMQTATKAAAHTTREAVEWFDRCFTGSTSRANTIRACVTGSDEWKELEDWPSTASVELQLASGRLVPDTDEGRTSFTFDPADPTPAVGGATLDPTSSGAKDNRALASRPDVATFTGEPLAATMTICGRPELELHLFVDNPSADVFVRLCDVDRRGRSSNVSDAFLRLDPAVPAGQEQVLSLTLDPCWHQVESGHRLQLLVAGGAHPRFARNLGSAEEPTAQPHTVLHAGTTLRLPVVSG